MTLIAVSGSQIRIELDSPSRPSRRVWAIEFLSQTDASLRRKRGGGGRDDDLSSVRRCGSAGNWSTINDARSPGAIADPGSAFPSVLADGGRRTAIRLPRPATVCQFEASQTGPDAAAERVRRFTGCYRCLGEPCCCGRSPDQWSLAVSPIHRAEMRPRPTQGLSPSAIGDQSGTAVGWASHRRGRQTFNGAAPAR